MLNGACFCRSFDCRKNVMVPDEASGLGILEVADETEAWQFGENDPSVRAGLNRWELYPLPVANSRTKD